MIPIGNDARIDARGAQLGMKQQACARAACAIDKSDIAPLQVTHAANIFWIAVRDHQAVLAESQVDEHDVVFRQEMLDERNIVFTGLDVEQMRARDVGLMLREREQSADAADRMSNGARELGKSIQ